MKLFLCTVLTIIAFAANSILNRMALAEAYIDPASFACLRIASGILVLSLILGFKGKLKISNQKPDLRAIIGLSAYMLGFSFAYLTLDAGIGALILFGGVQITMFAGALIRRQHLGWPQWLGSVIAFSGLIYLLLPSEININLQGMMLMTLAAIGWGTYSLRGQLVSDPLKSTWMNFIWALIPAILLHLIVGKLDITQTGLILAIISGGVTSALGYALWYQVLPQIKTSTAAVSQLTVPLIATGGGILFLNEAPCIAFAIASCLVLGGVALSVCIHPSK